MIDFPTFAAAFHAHKASNPNTCVFLGLDKNLDRLPDPSESAAFDEVESARRLLVQLDDVEAPDFDTRLDLDLARLSLERDISELTRLLNGDHEPTQKPRASDGIGDGIFMMFINDPRPGKDRLSDILSRLAHVPDYLEATLERLDTPVERWVAMDLEKAEGLPELIETLVAWGDELAFPDKARLRSVADQAISALASYRVRLAAMPTSTNIHLGDEESRRTVALRGIELPLEELHGIARDFLARTHETLDDLRARLVHRHKLPADTTLAGLHTWLNERYRLKVPADQLDKVLEAYEDERARILSFIRERDLFPILDRQDMKILRTPPFMEPSIPAGAMVGPAPFREGIRRSLVYLTLSSELLDEHTRLGIPNMMIHEGIPGHHLQLATASTHPSIIRRHFDATDLAEGWTTMLEDYILDLDYMGELTDEARFVAKREICRLGARVGIDLFFMTGDKRFLDLGVDVDISSSDPFVAAGNLLQSLTGFVPGRVQAELNWYSQERGYPLSYLTGNHLVWALKRDVIEAQRGKLEGLALDRAFHRTFLHAGNMPLPYLRRVFAHEGLIPA